MSERLLAERDGLLKWVEEAILPFRLQISTAGEGVQITGDEVAVDLASKILQRVGSALPDSGRADMSSLKATISSAVESSLKHELGFRLKGLTRPIRPMSLCQVAFMQTLLSRDRTLVIGTGTTGTGKTHLAIAAGLNQLALEHVKHIVITRPHVVMEGEIVTPAARQETEYDEQFSVFEDILRDLIGHHEFSRLVEQRMLEITPLGRMRGRTFNDSFIIIDEAQNMTVRKMRMAVTRIGQGSRMVVTGDPTQVDLHGDEPSGFAHLLDLVQGTDIATVISFENHRVIRHEIVGRLEGLYARRGGGNAAMPA